MENIDEFIEKSKGESFENCLNEAINRLKKTLHEHISQKTLQKTKETLHRMFPKCLEFTESIEAISDETEETELHSDTDYRAYVKYRGMKFYFRRTFNGSSDHKCIDEDITLEVVDECNKPTYFIIREDGALMSHDSETFMKILNYMDIPKKILTRYIRILLDCHELTQPY